ncbi:MAG: hypothetical protein ACLR2E_11475 [Lachnospiraceae bacterium]
MISKKTLREKILAYLSLQAETQHSRYFESPLGRVELAEYLCADRSALTRELAKMKKKASSIMTEIVSGSYKKGVREAEVRL